MKKQLLYICADYCVENRFRHQHAVGIQKKIDMQRRCFEKAGYVVRYGILHLLPQNIYPGLTDINLFANSMDWNKIDISKPVDVVYIRFCAMESGLLVFLHKVKRKNKNVKILFEFPTFPVSRDFSYRDKDFTYYKFQLFTKLLKIYVDRVVLCSPDYKKVYGIKVLHMPNGVEYRNTAIIPQNYTENEIHLIMVSSMTHVHGIDRIIKGMGTYYMQRRERKVVLHLVGAGIYEDEYRNLVKEYRVADYVRFEGYCVGNRLNDLYLLADIGIYAFGIHRNSKDLVSSGLKLKEAASYGLPIIGSGRTDMDHDACMEYMLKFPENETDIDVNKIISFYDKVYNQDKTVIRNTIKEVFRPYYDVQETLKKVLDYLEV